MKKLKNKKTIPKVLFYTTTPRIFRTTFIGHLYEISQKYPMILLSEKLDQESQTLIKNKKLFPKIEKIIEVYQYTGKKTSLFQKNIYLRNFAREIIDKYKPDIVISDNDLCLFELYLLRFAKKAGSLNICFQGGFLSGKMKEISFALNLVGAYLKIPEFLRYRFIRLFLARTRKYLGHLLYYLILPLSAKEYPFFGKSSCIFWKGNVGMRDADYYIVFSERDLQSVIADGVKKEKVYILSHPLERQIKDFFKKAYFSKQKKPVKEKILTVMWTPEEIGFAKKDFSLISKEEMKKSRQQTIALISDTLKGWQVFIKPHPDTPNFEEIEKDFKNISEDIKVVNPREPADKYIEISDVIAGFPPADTAIFTSLLQCPQKPILFLDLLEEFLGDTYLHPSYRGIDYITNYNKLSEVLEKIAKGRYGKKQNIRQRPGGFLKADEIVAYLYQRSVNKI